MCETAEVTGDLFKESVEIVESALAKVNSE